MILLLGVLLRFYRMDEHAAFRADQAIELSGARDILKGDLTLIGIKTSNSEVRNGAVMYYLLAPFVYLFQEDPRAGGVLQTLFSLGTILVVFLIIKNNIGTKQALYGAFLTASSSLLVIYSRQTMLAFYPLFFISLIFLVCTAVIKKYRPLMVICLGLLLGFSMQIHYSTLALFFVALVIRPRLNYFALLLAGFILGFSPMIAFELRHEFFNIKMALALVGQQSGHNLVAGINAVLIFWQDALSRFLFTGNIWLTRIYLLTLVGSLIYLRNQLEKVQKLSLLFILFSIIFTVIFSKDLRPPFEYISHYAIVSFVPLIILTSWLLGKLSSRIAIVILVAFLLVNFPAYRFSATSGFSHSPGWNSVGIKKAANIIKSDLTNRPYNVLMLVDAETQGHPLRFLLGSLSNKPLPVERYDQAKDLYVIAEPGIDIQNFDLWELNSFGSRAVKKTWSIQNGYTLYKLSKQEESKSPSFVTLIYPVRSRALWGDKSLIHLVNIFNELETRKFKSTWLLQYDALEDKDLAEKIKQCPSCEFGLFLEVSENLATDSNVSYILGDGHWYRPDKIFLSGYSLSDRVQLLETQFEKFKKTFGNYPKSVGVWYLDPFSQNFIEKNYGVTGVISVADQFDTDGQRYWGKPWGTPYYSQKINTLAPANNPANKSNIVQLQWAQRHPSDAFGSGPKFSQFSLQANDYVNNKKDTEYFKTLLEMYLFNPKNPFGQATIGLEVGQELLSFWDEHLKQLDYVANYKTVTQSEFSDWYKKTYPGVSPITRISDGKTTWVNTSWYRAGYKNGKLLDIRNYNNPEPSVDLLSADKNPFMDREIKKVSQIPKYDKNINLENYNFKIKLKLLSEKAIRPLSIFKWSEINGSKIIGVQTGKETIFAFWQGRGVKNYTFPFQTLAKFNSLAKKLW